MYRILLFFLLIGLPTAGLRAQTAPAGGPAAPAGATPPLGLWADDTGETHVELFRCGEQLCGRIAWLHQPDDPATGQPRRDEHNPDADRRQQPLLGLVVLRNLRYNPADDRWADGQIYDPSNGRTYACYVRPDGPDRLEVKGYIGMSMLGRSHYWTRVK